MNKAKIDALLPTAVEVLRSTGIANEKGEINKTYRGQISTLGAAISSGSLLAAVAFFSDRGGASVDRTDLTRAIYELITGNKTDKVKDKDKLFEHVESEIDANRENACKEDVLNAAIALKLAMNVYVLKKD